MPHVCDLLFPPPQKPGMVPPPPGEESQTVVLPPGWQSYLSPQGRRYYVNTATNGESCSGQLPTAAPGVLSVWRGTSLLYLLGFRPFLRTFPQRLPGNLSFPQDWVAGGQTGVRKADLQGWGSSLEAGIFVEPNLMVWDHIFQTGIL